MYFKKQSQQVMVDFIDNCKKIYRKDLIFYVFLIIYGSLLIFLSYKLNIWEDESYSLHTTSNNLATVISQSYNFEGQPPVYFLLLAIWRYIDSGIFFARLFSLFFIGLSAFFFLRIVRLVSGFECSRWMLVIFLLNPFTVWASLEIRLYAFIIFLSTISIYYFFCFYIKNTNKYLYLFLITSLIGLYTQYFFIVEITAFAFSILAFKGWKRFLKFCLYLIPVGILFLPNLLYLHQQVEMVQSEKLNYSIIHRIFRVLHSPQNLMLSLQMVPFNLVIRIAIRIIFLLIIVYSYSMVYKKTKILQSAYFEYLNVILLSICILIFLYSGIIVFTGIIFQFKYMAIGLPFLVLIFTLLKIYSYKTRNLIYVILSIYYISLLISHYKHPIKCYDFKSVGQFVKNIEYNKEPILFYSKSLLPPFTYYYKGENPLFPLPNLKFDHNYYNYDDNINDTLDLKQAIKKIESSKKSYILITGNLEGFKYAVNMNQEILDKCLKANYNIILDTSFLGETRDYSLRIRRLESK